MAKNKKKKKKLGKWVLFRDGLINTVLSLVVCYLLSLLFLNITFFNPLTKALQDFSFLDVYYSERLNADPNIEPNILLINIEHKTRNEIGLMLKDVLNAKPKVVGFDVVLKEFRKTVEDSLLASYLDNKRVVNSFVIDKEEFISNHSFFSGSNDIGFVNFNFNNQNSVIREFDSEIKQHNKTYKSFSLQIAKKYLNNHEWKNLNIDKKLKNSSVINYKGNLEKFLSFSIDEFMLLKDKSIVENKIVLVGYLGTPTGNVFDVEDKHFTPLNEITSGKSIPDMYGLVIHANIIAMILNNSFMFEVGNGWIFFLMFFFSLLASIYFIWLSRRLKISYRTARKAVLFVFAILLVWFTLVLFKKGIVIKSAPIIAVTVFSAGFIKFYKHLVRWMNTKLKFKSYLK